MKTLITFAMLIALAPAIGFASSNISFGVPGVTGNGCTNAVVHWEQTPKGNTLLIVEANSSVVEKKPLSRLVCTIAIPVSMSKGDKLKVKSFALISNLDVPKKSKATLSAEVFSGASSGQKLTKKVTGGSALTPPALLGKDLLSLSDNDANIRVNASVMLQNQNKLIYGRNGIQSIILELESN